MTPGAGGVRKVQMERLVQGMLPRGLSADEARQIHAAAVGEGGALSPQAKQQLADVSERFGQHFTGAGAREWKRLTGIGLSAEGPSYPSDFGPVQSLISLRSGGAREKAPPPADRKSPPHRTRPEPPAMKPWVQAIDHDTAVRARIPAAVLSTYLEANVGRSEVVGRLIDRVREIEATVGDNDGQLAPRDLHGVEDRTLKAVMARVYRQTGKKRLPLATIEAAMPTAVLTLLSAGQNRVNPGFADLYTELVRECAAWIGRRYEAEVLETGDKNRGQFYKLVGFQYPSDENRLSGAIPGLLAKPNLQQLSALWKGLEDGKISNQAFTLISQRPRAEVEALAAAHPELFPRSAEAKADAPPEVRPTRPAKRPKKQVSPEARLERAQAIGALIEQYLREDVLLDVPGLVARLDGDPRYTNKWGPMTEGRYKGFRAADPEYFPDLNDAALWLPVITREIKALLADDPTLTHQSVLAELRRKHPAMTMHHVATVGMKNPGLFGGVGRKVSNTGPWAKAVAARAWKLLEQDALMSRGDLIARLNEDAGLVRRFGPLDDGKYGHLAQAGGVEFPGIRDPARWMPALETEIAAILREEPDLTRPDLFDRMKARHPRLGRGHFERLGKVRRGLLPNSHAGRMRRFDPLILKRIEALLKSDPELSRAALTEALVDTFPWVDVHRVSRIINRNRVQLEKTTGIAPAASASQARRSAATSRLYSLMLRLVPPGLSNPDLTDLFNRQLDARGIPPYTHVGSIRRLEKPVARFAQITADIVAEYARAAPAGAKESEIFEAVLADYPSLSAGDLKGYRERWAKRPNDHPALAPFFRGKKLALSGQGERVSTPRFLGGWDVQRVIDTASPEEQKELAELSQYARIPASLPILDKILQHRTADKPLLAKNVLTVSHLLATFMPMSYALREAGAASSRTITVGTPYGSNRTVVDVLRDDGFEVRVPTLSVADYKKTVEKALDDIVALHRENGYPVVVMDDGGLVADLLHSKKKYEGVRHQFKLVEQTTGGIIVSEKHALETPIINAARARSKVREGLEIGDSVARKVKQALDRAGGDLQGKKALVMGYGTVGAAVAEELHQAGVEVTVIERSRTKRVDAEAAGYATSQDATPSVVSDANLVIGCTGTTSVPFEVMKRLPDGAVMVSASSKQVELEMDTLRAEAQSAEPVAHDNPLVTLPSVEYQLDGKSITVLGDGWPVNFDGDIEDIAPEKIQITRALMFAAALQASALSGRKDVGGLVPFDPEMDQQILDWFREMNESDTGVHPSRDPSEWRQVLIDVAESLSDEL